MMKHFLLSMILLASEAVWASASDQLEAFLQDLETFQADFQQILQLPEDGGVYTSRGTFYLKRPGLLRWEYAAPNPQLIVADGRRVWLHDFELEQISHRSQKAALGGTPAQLLSEDAPIDTHFEVKPLGSADEAEWLELLPKDEDAQFSRLRLEMMDNRIRSMELLDSFGQTTYFLFSNIQLNPPLADELFVFEPPSGIDLIGDL